MKKSPPATPEPERRQLSESEKSVAIVRILKHLPHNAAAWLAGVSPRALRDVVDLPRNADGSFDAQEILTWVTKKRFKGIVGCLPESAQEFLAEIGWP